jgi:HAD superfamily hydrolase (TIGR01509 family)
MSNNSPDLLNVIEAQELDGLFDAVVISAQIGVMKPAPGAFQAILDRLGVGAPDAVFIDDFPPNVEGARAAGMQAIHFKPGTDLPATLRSFLDA